MQTSQMRLCHNNLNIHIIVENEGEELFTADSLSFEGAVEEIGKLERAYNQAEADAEFAEENQRESLEEMAQTQKAEANDTN